MRKIKICRIGRRDNFDKKYEITMGKNFWSQYSGFDGVSTIGVFCAKEWEKLTGFKLSPGQCVKFRRTTIKNGFKFEIVK